MSQTSLNFYLPNRFLLAEMSWTGFFSSLRFYCVLQAWLNRIFSSWRFYFSTSQPDPLIVGASDIGHGYYGPETGDRVRESNPGPTQKIACRPGVRTLDRLKRSFVRSCTRSLNTIARTIVKINVRTKMCADAQTFHVECVRWMTDDGQTDRKRMTDRPFKK